MQHAAPRGTQGYAEEAETLVPRYEAMTFAQVHASVLHLLPPAPARVIDIGAGSGRDAAHLASLGHDVLAVEPTDALREPGRKLHPSGRITWLADSLPGLNSVRARKQAFDLIMMTAVWMHLDEAEREEAMPNVASLARPGGRIFMAVRHGPVPKGRRMFEIPAEDIIEQAKAQKLGLLFHEDSASIQATNQAMGVAWTRLVFEKERGEP